MSHLPCSGKVFKAELHGEVVAAKEVPLSRGALAQSAFVSVSRRA